MNQELWFWPSSEEVNDFPDPVAFDAEWHPWRGDLADGPRVEAEIFSREYLQNAWDSIQTGSSASKGSKEKGKATFRFVELTGKSMTQAMSNLGIDEFSIRYSKMSERNRKDARLSQSEIATTSKPKSLRLLVCSESGGDGMWGHWRTGGDAGLQSSRLRFALIQTASEKKDEGSGGSWGHGKKAIANASKCRTVIVYTAHPAKGDKEDKPGVTRRLIGVSYWRRHQADGREHVGLGVLGKLGQESDAAWHSFDPFENEDADKFVSALGINGFELRNPEVPSQRGTTYVIVEPSFEPEDLKLSLERNWWPLISQHKLAIELWDYDGSEISIQPESRSELLPFIDAFRVASGFGGTKSAPTQIKVDGIDAGNLAVEVDVSEGGYSYRSDVEGNTSIVALVRNDMVIAYQQFPKVVAGKPPYVRGAFNVDRERNSAASDLLKMAEPHLHNEWRTNADGATPSDAADLAKAVLQKIDRRVRELRDEYSKPQAVKDLHFDVFAEMLSGADQVLRRPTTKIGIVEPRDFRIHEVSRALVGVNPNDVTEVGVSASAKISLSQEAVKRTKKAVVKVSLSWKVLEDGEGGVVDAALADHAGVKWPPGFKEIQPGTAEGIMTALPIRFEWSSQYFPDDWQVLPFPRVDLIQDDVGADQGVSK